MLPFSQNVVVGTNEIVSRFSMNRNFEKLLSNDLYLSALYNSTAQGMNIQEYQSQKTYDYGDTIWFNPQTDSTTRYMLKCIIDNNTNNPILAVRETSSYVNGLPFFQKYGWYNQNQIIPISSYELGITNEINSIVNEFYENHEESSDEQGNPLHRFGRLSLDKESQDNCDKKLLKSDATNAKYPRQKIFFPSESGRFTTDSILNGIYRKWDNGLIEIDISYRLGYKGKKDVGGYQVDILSCNDLRIRPSSGSDSSFDRTDNMQYFNSVDDMGIFSGTYGTVGKVGNQWHGNRNDYVNVYSANLDFSKAVPTGFIDTNYMIFSSDGLSQKRIEGTDAMSPGTNTVTFCNRSRRSITAVYVTTPSSQCAEDGYFAKSGCMCSQSFSCHIVGRWK